MPTFFARRYMRRVEAVGFVEKTLGAVILLLMAGIVTAFVIEVRTNRDYHFSAGPPAAPAAPSAATPRPAAPKPATLGPATPRAARPDATEEEANPFPEAGVAGWRAPAEAEVYEPHALYEKIDGQADELIEAGCTGLTFGTYTSDTDATNTIDVYWYDMGRAEAAAALYTFEKPPDAPALSVGAAGYQAGSAVFFWKGTSYVQILPSRPDEPFAAAAREIAEQIADRIRE
jgi:hypothetical protein